MTNPLKAELIAQRDLLANSGGGQAADYFTNIVSFIDRWEALANLAICPYCDGSGTQIIDGDPVKCPWHAEKDFLVGE
jgi:hypothetical protein